MGRVIAAYRNHPFHGRALQQEIVAGWVGITQAQLSRIENGSPMTDLGKLCQWTRILGVPASLLWFKLPQSGESRAYDLGSPASNEDLASAIVGPSWQRYAEIDDMNRRELLRLLAIAGVALATPHIIDQVDWDRVDHAARTARLDAATADEYATLNAQLWQIFATSQAKSVAFPLVRSQLGVLTNGLQQARGSAMRQRLCGLVADLFQLAGKISFDANRYTDAAHCYTLAATASKEAGAFDLWACAMTRHAFIGVYERQFREVLPMLILAADLARNGDRSLSTRHWVSTVQAHTFAGLGDLDACQKSLDDAEHVRDLTGQVHNSGWLRFEGSRLAEERGTCYVELGLPDLAETALNDALRQNLSARRRGSVLTDLAMTGVQRRDPDRILTYATSALDTARHGTPAPVSSVASSRAYKPTWHHFSITAASATSTPRSRTTSAHRSLNQARRLTLSLDHGRIFREAWIAGVTKHYPGEPKPSYVTPWDDTPDWERHSAAAVYEQVRTFIDATDGKTTKLTRAQKSRFVALCWIGQILKHFPDPKPAYIADWDDLPQWQQETDADIFEHIEQDAKNAQPH